MGEVPPPGSDPASGPGPGPRARRGPANAFDRLLPKGGSCMPPSGAAPGEKMGGAVLGSRWRTLLGRPSDGVGGTTSTPAVDSDRPSLLGFRLGTMGIMKGEAGADRAWPDERDVGSV